jgi:hypothetical protein
MRRVHAVKTMSTAKRRQHDCIDRWTLHRKLGAGGDAEVWVARRDDDEVALKILKRNDKNSEPYKRLRQEVQALRALADVSGVLPLLDYSLPEQPDFRNPAWLAMPVATPLQESDTSGKAGGLKTVNRSKRSRTVGHLKVAAIQTDSVDRPFDLRLPVS